MAILKFVSVGPHVPGKTREAVVLTDELERVEVTRCHAEDCVDVNGFPRVAFIGPEGWCLSCSERLWNMALGEVA